MHWLIAVIALVVVMCLWRWLFRKERGMENSKLAEELESQLTPLLRVDNGR